VPFPIQSLAGRKGAAVSLQKAGSDEEAVGGEKKERFQGASIKPEGCSEDFAGVNP
jgi:hypothetical protein